ncbi:MAG TPA: CBS domain-containing protein [Gaiellaceae bacterium]|nr:CBS domain-containing protein [Gaiellaceae bacterium]
MKIEDLMTRDVVVVKPGASLKQAAELLVEHRISGLPVVDDENNVLGVFSEADVLPKETAGVLAQPSLAWLTGFDIEVDRSKLDARVVGEAMTSPALTIEAEAPVSKAARLMSEKGINRLPVVDEGKLVGIVTRADLVRAFVRSDAEIAEEIREELVVGHFGLDRRSVAVEVEDGEVMLGGRLQSRAEAELLVALVGAVPGVVTTCSRLSWPGKPGET